MTTITHRKNNLKVPVDNPPADAPWEKLHDFYWTSKADPHGARRKQIIAKYPQVTKLNGHEPLTKWIVMGVVSLQVFTAIYLRHTDFFSWKFWLFAYVIGATANQNIFLAIHELSHNLGFKKPVHNKLFSVFTNLPIGIPYAASFQPYHQLHHKFLGDDVYDTDLPTRFEAMVLSNVLGKAFFATFQIFFYALRPMFITQIKLTWLHLVNICVQFSFDFAMVKFFGWNTIFYFLLSSFLAGSLHPCSGHFIAEHYVMLDVPTGDVQPLETYSYYGILNLLTWNVGLHNEHHDFPFVAWSKLWELNKVASEFYDPLPKHTSWVGVIWDFVTRHDITLYNRVRRSKGDITGVKLDAN